MLASIHQLHYLPWLRYFDKIARAGVFIVLDNIQFNKNGWQNRNKIKTAQGAAVLTVPVINHFQQDLDQVEISQTGPWRKKHWQSIRQNYGKAPFFDEHAPFLEATYAREWRCLNDLNRHMLAYFTKALGITTPIRYASELNVPGTATERLVELMQAVGASAYYSGAFALEAYLDAALLEKASIRLELQEWIPPRYPQRHGGFVPDLSILDLLLNCGPDSLDVLLAPRKNTP